MSVPSIMIEPLSGLSRPIRVLRNTDLPVPDGPSITQISPGGMVRVTSPQISCLPKDLLRSLTSISTPIATLPLAAGTARTPDGDARRSPCSPAGQRPRGRKVTRLFPAGHPLVHWRYWCVTSRGPNQGMVRTGHGGMARSNYGLFGLLVPDSEVPRVT